MQKKRSNIEKVQIVVILIILKGVLLTGFETLLFMFFILRKQLLLQHAVYRFLSEPLTL